MCVLLYSAFKYIFLFLEKRIKKFDFFFVILMKATDMSFKCFIANNEETPCRINKRFEEVTFSSNPFLATDINKNTQIIFQMIQDIHFNLIAPKDGYVDITLICMPSNVRPTEINFNEQSICKKILRFQGSIEKHIHRVHGVSMLLNSVVSLIFLEKVLGGVLPQEMIEYIYKMTNNVQLEFMVNDYNGDYYISNPSFVISKAHLRQLVL